MEYNDRNLIGSILNDMTDGVIIVDFDGNIKMHNHAAETVLGKSGADLNGQSVADVMKKSAENDTFFSGILEAVSGKQLLVKTVPYFRSDEMLYLRITTNFLSGNAEQTGMLIQITDITEATMLFIANKRLANQVTNLMNSFVDVMVTAIEEKSSYNANHTKNMVRYAANYLEWLENQGKLTEHTSVNTAPLLMSVWLHDIGKLIVPPEVMDKPTRLGNAEINIRHRIETSRLMLQIRELKNTESAEESRSQRELLDQAEALIFSANTAGFLDDTVIAELHKAANIQCFTSDGNVITLLDESELEAITVQRGTLTAQERRIIESHVTYTRMLLSKVEFRGDYKPVPKWAAGHHGLLDGSGYPDHLSGDMIPWETRLLTIIDIYDALTAEDRPYKPPDKAFAILRDMADAGKIDSGILKDFIKSGAWKHEPDKS